MILVRQVSRDTCVEVVTSAAETTRFINHGEVMHSPRCVTQLSGKLMQESRYLYIYTGNYMFIQHLLGPS